MTTAEIWKPIKGFEGRYAVSDLGRVYSYARGKCLKLQPIGKKGYLTATLGRGCVAKLVHRLVAQAFIIEQNEAIPDVLHRDDDVANNRLDNLYYGNALDNAGDRNRNGNTVRGERTFGAKLTVEQALAIRNDKRTLKIIGAEYGVHLSTISLIRRGRNWRHV